MKLIEQTEVFAIDGNYNSREFYNRVSIGVYDAGYILLQRGKTDSNE